MLNWFMVLSGLLYPSTFLYIQLIFENLILKLQLKIIIYLLKNNYNIQQNYMQLCSVFSKSPVNVLSQFHNLIKKKRNEIKKKKTDAWALAPLIRIFSFLIIFIPLFQTINAGRMSLLYLSPLPLPNQNYLSNINLAVPLECKSFCILK